MRVTGLKRISSSMRLALIVATTSLLLWPGRAAAQRARFANELLQTCVLPKFPRLQAPTTVERKLFAFEPESGRTFTWDREKRAWIDVKSLEDVCPEGLPGGVARPLIVGRRPMFRVGFVYDYNSFGDFTSTVGNQAGLQSIQGDNSASGYGAFVEYMYSKKCPLFWGLEYHTSRLTYVQQFANTNPLLPTKVDGRVVGQFLGAYTGYAFRLGRIGVRPKIGVVRVVNYLTVDEFFQSLVSSNSSSSSLTNYKTDLGVNIDVPLWEGFGVRFGGDYTTAFKSGDADRNSRASVGVEYRIKSRW